MKNIGVMTWFSYHNYGSALQVTALNKKIRELGYNPEVINYIPHGKVRSLSSDIYSEYVKKIKIKLKNKGKREYKGELREEKFNKFLNDNLILTDMCRTSSELFELNDKFDAFVCGSDQIWAPTCFNPKYFLDFVLDNRKKISYAPSIGLTKIEDIYVKNRMKENISSFDNLSIREEQGKKLIKDICGKEAKVVLDPTLLLKKEDWKQLESNIYKEEKYILCYFLGNNKNSWESVNKIAKKSGLKVKVIPVFEDDFKREYDVINDVGPSEFLELIKKASLVCTDSFHGTVFSIIYEKSFYTYERFSKKDGNSQNSRIYNILNITELTSRLKTEKNLYDDFELECDFDKAKLNLEIKREESLEFLRNSLQNSCNIENSKYKITNTCCGCNICSNICGKNAITININLNGFLEATIDSDKCTKCGLCKKVCPYNKGKEKKISNKNNLYMFKSNEKNVLLKSSSGGASHNIVRNLFENGYDVVGCRYNKELMRAEHIFINEKNKESLTEIQGSKYIQSYLSDELIKKILNSNKAVITGTPCQIAGIAKLLETKKIREKFILIDLICHGVPSIHLWYKYLENVRTNYNCNKKMDIIFRDKEEGWRSKTIKFIDNKKTIKINEKKDIFYRFFELENCYMNACYECKFRESSYADIRLGDYWGPRFVNDKDGVSMILGLTDIGINVIENLKNKSNCTIERYDIKEYWSIQFPKNKLKPVYWDELINDMRYNDIEKVANKYCEYEEKNKNIYKKIKQIKKVYKKVF